MVGTDFPVDLGTFVTKMVRTNFPADSAGREASGSARPLHWLMYALRRVHFSISLYLKSVAGCLNRKYFWARSLIV